MTPFGVMIGRLFGGRRAPKLPLSRLCRGCCRGIVDAETKKILGAAILGTGGDEAVHCITAIMYADAPYRVLQRAVQIHPTVAELIPTMLGEMTEA